MTAPAHRRVAALVALGLYTLAFVGTLVALVQRPLLLVAAWISMTVASIAAWYIITRRRAARVIASLVAGLALIGLIVSFWIRWDSASALPLSASCSLQAAPLWSSPPCAERRPKSFSR